MPCTSASIVDAHDDAVEPAATAAKVSQPALVQRHAIAGHRGREYRQRLSVQLALVRHEVKVRVEPRGEFFEKCTAAIEAEQDWLVGTKRVAGRCREATASRSSDRAT